MTEFADDASKAVPLSGKGAATVLEALVKMYPESKLEVDDLPIVPEIADDQRQHGMDVQCRKQTAGEVPTARRAA